VGIVVDVRYWRDVASLEELEDFRESRRLKGLGMLSFALTLDEGDR
jgi:hypothetical protein